MSIIGQFKITDSFKITGRGLVAIGELTVGKIKIGCWMTFHTGVGEVTMKIASFSLIRASSPDIYPIGVTFVYNNEEERIEFEKIKLVEQVVNIEDRVAAMD